LIGLFFVYKSYTATYKTLRGQNLTVVLPDNSEVKLNSESVLRYKVFNWGKNRKVTFEGEGFFKIRKKGLFIVDCGDKSITVFGTNFNVYSRQDNFEIQCFSGKIKITDSHSFQILTAGMATKSDKNNILCEPYFYKSSKAASWRNGEFYFDGVPLMNVFTEIERQFDVKIEVSDIDNKLYTGYFKNTNLKNTLDTVCLPMGLTYSIKGKKITIKQ
jgi:ferric-dicitrate binding protein FerR (iron transport regulator)